mgnify:CR=1 FL=1|jgi:hypothetical protein
MPRIQTLHVADKKPKYRDPHIENNNWVHEFEGWHNVHWDNGVKR